MWIVWMEFVERMMINWMKMGLFVGLKLVFMIMADD